MDFIIAKDIGYNIRFKECSSAKTVLEFLSMSLKMNLMAIGVIGDAHLLKVAKRIDQVEI
ncbi:hypothetical protein M8C21_008500 [Ambrosia artemisiifolia]|uniref:Uncharacterized protein n=1 Tax=Ambrosia artemisiifolia TaxID=4212 RepID=A0AAD5D8M2_AMBAR|nr:hypothetical protein M8C21_008500 [Ambrosia artemisiifolia]